MAKTALAPQDPEPNEGNLYSLNSVRAAAGLSNVTVTPYNQGHWQPQSSWYPYYVQVPAKGDEERLRFALELIAEGGLTHEAVKQIAKRALKRD